MPVLTLKDYGIANGDKTILSSVTLNVANKGIVNILGPAAAGKSTLIRTLSGANNSNPNITTWGKVNYLGMPLGEAGYPTLVMQSTKLMLSSVLEYIQSNVPGDDNLTGMQKSEIACHLLEMANLGNLVDYLDKNVVDLPLETMRHLAIARVCAANPELVFINEPTNGFEKDPAYKLLNYIKAESEKRAVVVVSKNDMQARYLGGRTLRLVESQEMQEDTPTESVFSIPHTIVEEEFIENDTRPVSSNHKDNVQSPLALIDINMSEQAIYAPEGFILLKKGEIAGYEQELGQLQNSGVTHLISSTPDVESINAEAIAKYGISLIHEPINEMDVPTVERASHLCEEIGHLISQGHIVAIHCVPGFGGTGILLALHLIWEGQSAQQAIDTVRQLKPEWMESEEHVLYLEEFANETY